ncbi:uncharacterized protein LOC126369812 [Pectinophora gossypiella]|uniref:uncharacterized protein LOC126369812 n=1 Tax=Pectinophora gossypiella TaxID=13191 RepID=UPI00214F404B|nr:uncharacterized protein LOC126369812 [Pectinophora gossypiella]
MSDDDRSSFQVMKQEMNEVSIQLTRGSIVEITSDVKHWKNCTKERIFVDDGYTLSTVTPGTEITIGKTRHVCLEVVDEMTLKCKVIVGGRVSGNEYVKFRGTLYKRPPLTKFDLQLLEFAREFKLDILIIFGVRRPHLIQRVKKLTQDFKPLILSTICDQEGLDNIDDIIAVTDGIMLAREFLTDNLMNRYSLPAIQLQVCGKCKVAGKPFYVSGDILEQTLTVGTVSACDISDITNAISQGAGLILRNYTEASNAVRAVKILDSVCKSIESAERGIDEFWRNIDLNPVPQNAAVACVAACAALARQSSSKVVIIVTVTGKTAIQLSQVASSALTIAISKIPAVTRKLQMYRGIHTIMYDKPPVGNWNDEIEARINFAVHYAVKKDILDYNDNYVTLRKSEPTSSYCDNVGLWKVTSSKRNENLCAELEPSCPRGKISSVTPAPGSCT